MACGRELNQVINLSALLNLPSKSAEPLSVRFGVFEADLRKEELRKYGVRLKLQQQPFRVLASLLDRHGELVSREELIASLWPDGRIVDFDRGLNAAVTRLRHVLADSADSPKYIETVPGRGYRFIAPILNAVPEAVAQGPKRNWNWIAIGGVAAAAAILIAGWMWLRPIQPVSFQPGSLMRLTSDAGLTTMPTLSPDGTLLAYASDRGGEGNLDIWVQQIGGDPIRLTMGGANNYDPSFSPDGRKIIFRSEREGGGIYAIPALGGGEPVRLKSGGARPRYSPDGKWIAYTEGVLTGTGTTHYFIAPGIAKVRVMPASGGESREFCPEFASAAFPVWTPDGNHILFLGNRDPNVSGEPPKGSLPDNLGLDWWVAPLDAGPAIPTGTARALRDAGFTGLSQIPQAWLPTGDGVLVSGEVGDTRNLWVIPIARGSWKVSGRAYRLSFGTNRETFPAVSANGKIAFTSLNEAWDVWSLPMDMARLKAIGDPLRLTKDAAPHSYPAVSPDGKTIAYASKRTGSKDIWLKSLVKGGNEIAVSNTPSSKTYPSFSPDGSKLVYRSAEKGSVYYLKSLVGGAATKRFCEGCIEMAGWSPDGSRILCVRCSPGARIGVWNLGSDTAADVTDHPDYGLWNARFSPDGNWISFNATKSGTSKVFVARFTGGRIPASSWIAVTDELWADYPRWSPDGSSMFFFSERDGFRCLWAQRLDPVTKRPAGSAIGVYHPHQARLSIGNVTIGELEMSIARDKIVFNMGERTGSIWTESLSR